MIIFADCRADTEHPSQSSPARCPLCRQYCCGLCIWGSVMEAAELGSCPMCCMAIYCCPCCTLCKAGMDTGTKYGIEEGFGSACMKTCCCPTCYAFQIQNEIMSKEGLHYGCMKVEADAGAPQVAEMKR